jgi:predicted Zn-dependent protease
MFRVVIALFLMLVFSGCFSDVKPPKPLKANEKAFEEEDTYILFALRAEELREYATASNLFNTLWKKSGKREYLYKSLKNDLSLHRNEKVIKKVDEIQDTESDDFKLIRIKIVALLGAAKLEEARVLSLHLVEESRDVHDYLLVSQIYVAQKKFNTALKYLESAYIKDYNEEILDRMSIILYVNLERKKDAIAQLETHTRVHGCSKTICTRLISLYSNENDIDGILATYLRLYELQKDDKIAKRIVQIYSYKQEYIKLMSFLQKSKSDDNLLLQVYISTKNYKKAFKLAATLYSETGDISYLGQSAIFEYESSKDKTNKTMQNSVIKKLKEVLSVENIPLYANYLGYLLIDHSIDVKEGIDYVNKALEVNSDSAFYLDSLAWGYYRLGECEKAFKIIKRVTKLDGGDDPEVTSHLKTITECKNKNKGKNKK